MCPLFRLSTPKLDLWVEDRVDGSCLILVVVNSHSAVIDHYVFTQQAQQTKILILLESMKTTKSLLFVGHSILRNQELLACCQMYWHIGIILLLRKEQGHHFLFLKQTVISDSVRCSNTVINSRNEFHYLCSRTFLNNK